MTMRVLKGIFTSLREKRLLLIGISFSPNSWGLYNMHGNAFEWCSDYYWENYYEECKAQGVVENPAGPTTGYYRVLRGGGWYSDAGDCRSAGRLRYAPGDRYICVGFRLVFVP